MGGLSEVLYQKINWIYFNGVVHEADYSTGTVILASTDGSNGIIKIAQSDLKFHNGDLSIKLGSGTALFRNPSLHPQHLDKVSIISPNCINNCSDLNMCKQPDTYATGGIEFCCPYSKCIGSCDGYWPCEFF